MDQPNIPQCHITTLAHSGVRSLVWSGDNLIDWVAGGAAYALTGTMQRPSVNYAYPFDAAVASPSGRYAVIYTRFGTKGLILRDGKILREINRSFYQAHHYDYPIALFRLKNGREVIAHCPDQYCQIDIDDLETGTRLTTAPDRKPKDVFHSRLQASANGQYLVSAGWVWHPVDTVMAFDIATALRDPSHLDGQGVLAPQFAEHSSAAFDNDGGLIVALDGDIDDEQVLRELRLFDPGTLQATRAVPLNHQIGAIMPINAHYVLGLYDHPHVVDMQSGQIVMQFDDIASGKNFTSIHTQTTIIACDPARARCAIADAEKITILRFS
jgi:hypothetical protein